MPKLRSHRREADLHFGKLHATDPSSDHVAMRDLLKAVPSGVLPPIPEHFGHGNDFGKGAWGMLGNGPCDDGSIPKSDAAYQGAGDCAWAGPAHEEMEAAKDAGGAVPMFTCLNVLEQYSAYSGYDLKTGANDNGSDTQEVLKWRQTKGLVDANGKVMKIGQTVSLTPGDLNELWAAAYFFEAVGVGVKFQQAQMDQFDAGEPWDYVKGSSVEGGHYIPVMSRNGLISWGERVGFTQAWYEHLNDESFAYVSPSRYSAVTGKTSEGFDDQDLELYISELVNAA